MWQHHNGWQQNEDDPQNLQQGKELDSHICDAFAQGSSNVDSSTTTCLMPFFFPCCLELLFVVLD